MKQLIAVFLLLVATVLSAQVEYSVLHLKNGTVYTGNLVEYVPGNHATIKLPDNNVITVEDTDIFSLSVGKHKIVKPRFELKSKGYFNNTLAGPQFGKSQYSDLQTTFAFNTVNGYKINGHHAGLGLGLENHAGNWYAPIYADYSYHILKDRFSPLIGINGGFMVPLKSEADRNYRYDYAKGAFVGGRIGFLAYSNEHFAFTFNVTYRYIHLSGSKYSQEFFFPGAAVYSGSADLHRVGLMIGFVIN